MRTALAVILLSFSLTSCGTMFLPSAFSDPVFVGSKLNGLKKCRECRKCLVSPDEAHELALDHLEKSYELRNAKRNYPSDKLKMNDYILLKGKYYYIARDNYPYKTYWAYFNHAVRVNCMTGTVKEPE